MKPNRSKIWSHFPWQFHVDGSLDGRSYKNGKINVWNAKYRFDRNESLVFQNNILQNNQLYFFLSLLQRVFSATFFERTVLFRKSPEIFLVQLIGFNSSES